MKLFNNSLTDIYKNFIVESRRTEDEARNIIKRFNTNKDYVENVLNNLKQIDDSQNQKNLPAMAFFAMNQGTIVYEDLKQAFDLYNDLITKNKVQPLQMARNGIHIEGTEAYYVDEFWQALTHVQNTLPSDEEEEEVEVVNEDPIFANDKVEIYDGTNVGSCIRYTVGKALTDKTYSFCIGQERLNRHQSYRDIKASTFYYILDKTRDVKKDPLHIVVYDNTNKGVELTDENNVTGNIAEFGKDVEAYQNYLKSLGVPVEDLLVNIPHSDEEKAEIEKFKHEIHDIHWFKGLTYKEKKRYIGRGHQLGDAQFDYLFQYKAWDLIQLYADTHAFLNFYQLNKLNSNLKKTYFRRRFQQLEASRMYDLQDDEIAFLTPKIFDAYLDVIFKNSVRTPGPGVLEKLPEEYRMKYYMRYYMSGRYISPNELKGKDEMIQSAYAYAAAHGEQYMNDEYFAVLTEKAQQTFYREKAKLGGRLDLQHLENMPEELRREYFSTMIEKEPDYYYSPEELNLMPDELKTRMWVKKVSSGRYLTRSEIKKLPYEAQKAYVEARIKSGEIYEMEVEVMPEELQKIFYRYAMENDKWVDDDKIAELGMEVEYLLNRKKNGQYVTSDDVERLSPDKQIEYYEGLIELGEYIMEEKLQSLPEELQKKYWFKRLEDEDKFFYFPDHVIDMLSKSERGRYYENMIDKSEVNYLGEKELVKLPRKIITKYLDRKIVDGDSIYSYEQELLTKKQKRILEYKRAENGSLLDEEVFEKAPLKYKRVHLDNLLKLEIDANEDEFKYASSKQKWKFLKMRVDRGGRIRDEFWDMIPDKMQAKLQEYLESKR